MKKAVIASIVLLILPGVVLAGNIEKNVGLQFKDWGISFTIPVQWQRWPSAKKSTFAAQAQQSVIEEELVHLAGWSTADESAFIILTVKHERSGRIVQLSDLLARQERDDKRAMDYGDATKINCREIGKIAGRDCIIHDVTLRGGGRMLTYTFISGSEQVEIQWLFRDAARFEQLKPAVDGVIKTLTVGCNFKK